MAVWVGLVLISTIFLGGNVQSCLGPLDVTPESCRVALGLPPETAWDRMLRESNAFVVVGAIAIGWTLILGVDRWRRQRGGL